MEVFGLEINSLDDLIESDYESEADDMDNDKTFEPTEKELKDMERQDASDDDEMMTQGSVKDRKRKAKSSDGKDAKVKKKEREFELKSKIAQEVAKYPHIYDIRHKSFADKQLQASTWKKIAAAVDLEINQSVKFWESLKRSAKYYANEQKVPCKSGASTNEMSEQTYREEWPHREVMAFYTPPSLRDETAHIVLSNRRSNTPAKSINSDFDPALEDELRDAMSHCDTDSCYVCIQYILIGEIIVKFISVIDSFRIFHQHQHRNQGQRKIHWLKVYQ